MTRFFLYAAKLYEKYIAGSDYHPYNSVLQFAPCPKCVCFYNRTGRHPERQIPRLSDAFGGEGDIEVIITMLNINYGKNRALKNLGVVIDAAIGEMPDEFAIKRFLLLNKAEVNGMFLTEYDQEKVLSQERREVEYRVATDMLKNNYPISAIAKISKLSEEAIEKLAKTLGISIA